MIKEIYICTGEINNKIYETEKIKFEDKRIDKYLPKLKKGISIDIKI